MVIYLQHALNIFGYFLNIQSLPDTLNVRKSSLNFSAIRADFRNTINNFDCIIVIFRFLIRNHNEIFFVPLNLERFIHLTANNGREFLNY